MIFEVLEVVLGIAEACCSWRLFLSIGIGIGIVAGMYYMFPTHDGFWAISYPAAFMVIGLGAFWQIRADRR